MHIDELDTATAADDVVAEVVALHDDANAADAPWSHPGSVTRMQGLLRHGWDGEGPRFFTVREAGRLEATGALWTSEWDNRDLAWLDVIVHPRARRTGLGSAVVARLMDHARADGRTKAGIDGWDTPAADAFARSHGFERASQAINRRQLLAEVDGALVDKLYAEAESAAAGYDLLQITGRVPEDVIEAVSTMSAAINDAPTDELDIEDEVFPPERMRAYEDAQLATGQRLYRLMARHRDTGVLTGHTVVAVEGERPWIGHQHDTSVVREHRGHRLGLLLKTGMVRWLREAEPQLESVDTWNAESNRHMVAVNEQLGYRVLGRGVQYQRRLEDGPAVSRGR